MILYLHLGKFLKTLNDTLISIDTLFTFSKFFTKENFLKTLNDTLISTDTLFTKFFMREKFKNSQ